MILKVRLIWAGIYVQAENSTELLRALNIIV
jgi:hypothetical protein